VQSVKKVANKSSGSFRLAGGKEGKEIFAVLFGGVRLTGKAFPAVNCDKKERKDAR